MNTTRRQFLHTCAIVSATVGTSTASRASTAAPLTLSAATISDPDGHHPALKLKGDWLVIAVSDGRYTGLGEISHSRDDAACLRRVRVLFAARVAPRRPTRDLLDELAHGPFALIDPNLVTATAISGIDQALHDLVAQREGVPVWQLYTTKPVQDSVPYYLSTNRALRERAPADFVNVTAAALASGGNAVKITPFEAVKDAADKLAAAEEGFARIEAVRAAYPRVSLRVDCHEHFKPENIAVLLPRFARYKLEWLEEPCPAGPALAALRARAAMPFATGEMFFGETRFRELIEQRQADVIMPDPKFVGGFGPLVRVCRMAEKLRGQVSPHNPSGAVATYASVHAAAVSAAVTSTELILTSDPARQPGRELRSDGRLRIPRTAGWGLSLEQLTAQTGAQFASLAF